MQEPKEFYPSYAPQRKSTEANISLGSDEAQYSKEKYLDSNYPKETQEYAQLRFEAKPQGKQMDPGLISDGVPPYFLLTYIFLCTFSFFN